MKFQTIITCMLSHFKMNFAPPPPPREKVLILKLGTVGVCHWRFSNRTHYYTTSYPILQRKWANLQPIKFFCFTNWSLWNSVHNRRFATHQYQNMRKFAKNMQICNPWNYDECPKLLKPYPCQQHIPILTFVQSTPLPPPPPTHTHTVLDYLAVLQWRMSRI